MFTISDAEFEALVAEAWEGLPEEFRERVDNLALSIEMWPDPATMRRAKVQHPTQLLGFYHGVPQTLRTHRYGLVPPDRITLYRRPILMRCRNREDVCRLVAHVLRHELAHHFGIDDDHLRHIGAY